jgi:hypothetical protein
MISLFQNFLFKIFFPNFQNQGWELIEWFIREFWGKSQNFWGQSVAGWPHLFAAQPAPKPCSTQCFFLLHSTS